MVQTGYIQHRCTNNIRVFRVSARIFNVHRQSSHKDMILNNDIEVASEVKYAATHKHNTTMHETTEHDA